MRRGCSYIVLTVMALGLISCANDKKVSVSDGDGTVALNIAYDNHVNLNSSDSRALVTDQALLDELNGGARIRIFNSNDELVRRYNGISNIPAVIGLAADSYLLSVNAGDSAYAAFKKPYFTGSVPFSIAKGDAKSVDLTCNLVNTLLSVKFDPSLENFFKISTAKVQATTVDTRYGLIFTPDTTEKGYFLFKEDDTQRDINIKFTATTQTNELYEFTHTISNADMATEYSVLLKYNAPAQDVEGGAGIIIQVDESVVNKGNDIFIVEAPELTGNGFDLENPIYFEPGAGTRTVVWVVTASQLKGMELSSDIFTSMFGLKGDSFDFYTLTGEERENLANLGVEFDYSYNASLTQTTGKVVFSDEFMQKFDTDGEYVINIKATDYANNVTIAPLTIVASSATVAPLDINIATVYSNKAQLLGEVTDVERSTGPYTFQYKAVNADEWITVDATLADDNVTLTADIAGLSPKSAYMYRVADNGVVAALTKAFTTEGADQLPNSGFEYWASNIPGANSGALTLSSENGSLYWDCGNHGSQTMSVNVTNPSSDVRPGTTGTQSSLMKSQFVGLGTLGKFAAGNMFVGRYAGTDGTDGIIDMGRPFTDRPTGYSFWFKYAPGTVSEFNIPSGVTVTDMVSGGSDIGKIYIALGDWSEPVQIRTKSSNRKLFDINDSHIIAYGEYEMKSAVADWTQVTVDLEYRTTERKPTYILVVVSASKYGDYFTGGEGSTLYFDDLNLIYE